MKKNAIASLIKWVAWITLVVAIIVGITLGGSVPPQYVNGHLESYFAWPQAIAFWLGGGVSTVLLLGFAEIINLLQGIFVNTSSAKKQLINEEKAS